MSKRVPEVVPPRIAPLATLPLFHKVTGRKAVVAGGSPGALWKAELLSAAGAEVLVLTGHASAARLFDALIRAPIAGKVDVRARLWRPEDLEGAVIAVADLADEVDARRFAAAARAAGALANIIDRTDIGDAQFGTIVNRSPIVLGISTDGAAPMLGQSIRGRIEAVLPRGLSAWAEAAKAWRPRLRQRLSAFADRRGFWTRFTRRAWVEVGRTPTERDFLELVEGTDPCRKGEVLLVGAGPGDPELLTLRAVRALQSATVILHDDLVDPAILELARREAVRIAVGKRGHGPSVKQSEISRRLVALAKAGETVVRLKGGDPLVFGRATEEIEACRAAGIDVTIVPGISAAQGVAAVLGLSLTERRAARRVQFITGHGSDGRLPDDIEWSAIADPGATSVIYMPRATLAELVRVARRHGLDPNTPAVAIASATQPAQAHVVGTAADIAALAERLPAGAPVTVILGAVARHADRTAASLSEAA